MAFSSNIPTHLRRQVTVLLSLDQSMNELVTEALKEKPWRSRSPFLEVFPLCDTAVRSCSELTVDWGGKEIKKKEMNYKFKMSFPWQIMGKITRQEKV